MVRRERSVILPWDDVDPDEYEFECETRSLIREGYTPPRAMKLAEDRIRARRENEKAPR